MTTKPVRLTKAQVACLEWISIGTFDFRVETILRLEGRGLIGKQHCDGLTSAGRAALRAARKRK